MSFRVSQALVLNCFCRVSGMKRLLWGETRISPIARRGCGWWTNQRGRFKSMIISSSVLLEFNFQQTFHFLKQIFHNKLHTLVCIFYKPNFSFIWKISLSTILIHKVLSLDLTGVIDVYRFKWCIQKCIEACIISCCQDFPSVRSLRKFPRRVCTSTNFRL